MILELPPDCLSHILSFTSPKDVARSSAVSQQFLSVSTSNTIWDKFLPSHCDDIIYGASGLSPDLPKKDVFMHLCDFPVLLDDNTKSFALDKKSGKVCYMLGSRVLSVEWGETPEHWGWESVPESRFPECAVLKRVSWIDIHGRTGTTLLSRGTSYGAYFVFKINLDSFSERFSLDPVKVLVSATGEDGLPIGNHVVETKSVYLQAPGPDEEERRERPPEELLVVDRGDGWMEVEMGRYQVDVNYEMVVLDMILYEHESQYWKNGLIVHGIEIRPLS